mgnify:CR=1 FL=1
MGDIFIIDDDKARLSDFVHRLTIVTDISEVVERESSNYYLGHYFKAKLNNCDIKIYYLDTFGCEKYTFIISIDKSTFDTTHQIALLLCKSGVECFVPNENWIYTSWNGEGKIYKS